MARPNAIKKKITSANVRDTLNEFLELEESKQKVIGDLIHTFYIQNGERFIGSISNNSGVINNGDNNRTYFDNKYKSLFK